MYGKLRFILFMSPTVYLPTSSSVEVLPFKESNPQRHKTRKLAPWNQGLKTILTFQQFFVGTIDQGVPANQINLIQFLKHEKSRTVCYCLNGVLALLVHYFYFY